MEAEIQGLCAAIIDFLVHALRYQKKWGIGKDHSSLQAPTAHQTNYLSVKVLNGIIADFAKRFQVFISKIKGHSSKIEILAQRGYTTTLLDTKETLDRTAQSP